MIHDQPESDIAIPGGRDAKVGDLAFHGHGQKRDGLPLEHEVL